MNAVLLDTNAYGAFKRGTPSALAAVRAAPRIGITPVVIGELLGGFELGAKARRNRQELAEFLASPRVAVLLVTEATPARYGAIYAALRKAGTPIPTNDMWIAASAIQHGYALLSYDSHFARVPGLKRVRT